MYSRAPLLKKAAGISIIYYVVFITPLFDKPRTLANQPDHTEVPIDVYVYHCCRFAKICSVSSRIFGASPSPFRATCSRASHTLTILKECIPSDVISSNEVVVLS